MRDIPAAVVAADIGALLQGFERRKIGRYYRQNHCLRSFAEFPGSAEPRLKLEDVAISVSASRT